MMTMHNRKEREHVLTLPQSLLEMFPPPPLQPPPPVSSPPVTPTSSDAPTSTNSSATNSPHIWSRKTRSVVTPFCERTGPTFPVPHSPLQLFQQFFTIGICTIIAEQTNLYAKHVVYLYVSHPMYCMPLCLFLDVCTCVLRVPVYIMYCAC